MQSFAGLTIFLVALGLPHIQGVLTPPAPSTTWPWPPPSPGAKWPPPANASWFWRITSFYEPVSGANGTQIANLEIPVTQNCSAYIVGAAAGPAAPEQIQTSAYQFAKIIDFSSYANYEAYNNCTAVQPGRSASSNLTYSKIKVLSQSTYNTSGNAFFHVSASNVTNITEWVLLRNELLVSGHSTGEIDVNQDPTLSEGAQGLEIIGFPDTNTALGLYYYKNGNATNLVPILPLYAQIKTYQIGSAAVVEFHPTYINGTS